MTESSWPKLGAVAPQQLVEHRLAVHWAAQIVAAAAAARVPPRADFSHTNLGFDGAVEALVTHEMGDGRLRVGLRLASTDLLVLDSKQVLATLELAGQTLEEALTWLASQLDERLGSAVALSLLDHDMPAHSTGTGSPFPKPASDAYGELSNWFAVAHQAATSVADAHGSRASAARCWPHHFDLATLITIQPHDDPEKARTTGVGMTPGDGSYAEPYFYVTPWPPPGTDDLPELPAGRWHTEGWVGAVLTGSDVVASDDQRKLITAFIDGAVAASEKLVS